MREEALRKEEILAVVDTPKKIIVAFMWSLIGAVYTLGAFSGIMTVHPAIIVNNTANTEIAVEVMSAIGSLWTDPSTLIAALCVSMLVTVCVRAKRLKSAR